MRKYSAVAAAAVAVLGLSVSAEQGPAFPSAAIKIWDTAVVVPPSISLGLSPGVSVADAAGMTRHGTGSPTIVSTYANGTHPRGRSGVAYWNPDGNVFTWYGKTIGFPADVAVNRAGPTQPGGPIDPGPDLLPGTLDDRPTSFGPGDVWVSGHQAELLYVHIAGTDMFRTYATTLPIGNPGKRGWGVAVDQTTGFVYIAEPDQDMIARLDPATNRTKAFLFGGQPAYLAFDRAGNLYTLISDQDLILRVNRDDTFTMWRVPAANGITPSLRTVPHVGADAGLPGDYPNGMRTDDADGSLWFLETNSNEIGRLSGGADGVIGTADDQVCEFTSPGLLGPQQMAVTGAGPSLQVYFTEGDGNSVGVLTQLEVEGAPSPTRVCTTVAAEPFTDAFVFEAGTEFYDEKITPLTTVIIPTVHELPGTGGPATGAALTPDGKPLPPILRFSPMPNPVASADGTPIGDAGNGYPSGLTGVYAGDRVAGTYSKGNKHFELASGAVVTVPTPPPPPSPTIIGRMSGGGTTYASDGTRVNHGIVLKCQEDGKRDDLLHVEWGNAEFRLTAVTARSCTDDPAIATTPFDTHSGSGTGSYNGAAATVEWRFTDAGKRGDGDTARIVIRNAAGLPVLDVSDMLAKGDQQIRTR